MNEFYSNNNFYNQSIKNIGNKLSDFEDQAIYLGKGQYGSVYKRKSKIDNNYYAIKQLDKNSNNVVNFKRETEILKTINHHNIVKFYGIFEENNKYYLIFEFAENGSLKNCIEKYKSRFNNPKEIKPLKENFVIKLFKDILNGLNYLHNNNIIHRDIKPDNILLDNNNNAKITDFGISAFYKNYNPYDQNDILFMKNSIVGHKDFISPEIIRGQNYDFKCDIFSLGLTIFYLMSFSLPFDSIIKSSIKVERHFNGNTINQIYNINLRNLVNRMLDVNPDNRPNAIQAYEELIKIEQMIYNSQNNQLNNNNYWNSQKNNNIEYISLQNMQNIQNSNNNTSNNQFFYNNQNMSNNFYNNNNQAFNNNLYNSQKNQNRISNNVDQCFLNFQNNQINQMNQQFNNFQNNQNNQMSNNFQNQYNQFSNNLQNNQNFNNFPNNQMDINFQNKQNNPLSNNIKNNQTNEQFTFNKSIENKQNNNLLLRIMQCLCNIEEIDIEEINNKINPNSNESNQLLLVKITKIIELIKSKIKDQVDKDNFINSFNDFKINLFSSIKNLDGKKEEDLEPNVFFNEIFTVFNDVFKNNKITWKNTIFEEKNEIENLPKKTFPLIYKKIKEYENEYKNPFVDIFYFISLNTLKCPDCQYIFKANDIQINHSIKTETIFKNIEEYLCKVNDDKPENIKCSECYYRGPGKKEKIFYNTPKYLMIEYGKKEKNEKKIESTLDLSSHVLTNIGPKNYKLFAVISKENNFNYIAYIQIEKSWCFFSNEDSFEKCSYNSINYGVPYIAIYRGID